MSAIHPKANIELASSLDFLEPERTAARASFCALGRVLIKTWQCPLLGAKRTSRFKRFMSAFDPKQRLPISQPALPVRQ
jgi:hypothetical protein